MQWVISSNYAVMWTERLPLMCPGVHCRYRLSGLILPSLKDWFESTFGASLQHKTPATVSLQLPDVVLVRNVCLCVGTHNCLPWTRPAWMWVRSRPRTWTSCLWRSWRLPVWPCQLTQRTECSALMVTHESCPAVLLITHMYQFLF